LFSRYTGLAASRKDKFRHFNLSLVIDLTGLGGFSGTRIVKGPEKQAQG
jgi:hypothetical protein